MWKSLAEFHHFYQTETGRAVAWSLGRHIHAAWGELSNKHILALGYAMPFHDILSARAERLFYGLPFAMPLEDTASVEKNNTEEVLKKKITPTAYFHERLPWPAGSFYGMPASLPLPDRSINCVLMVHCLETGEPDDETVMREVWRVLTDDGVLLLIVPNRRSLWTRFEKTPFSRGLPYSTRQAIHLLTDTMFTPVAMSGALLMPPWVKGRLLRAMAWCERPKNGWQSGLGGALVIEARKELYAATVVPVTVRRRWGWSPFPHNYWPHNF